MTSSWDSSPVPRKGTLGEVKEIQTKTQKNMLMESQKKEEVPTSRGMSEGTHFGIPDRTGRSSFRDHMRNSFWNSSKFMESLEKLLKESQKELVERSLNKFLKEPRK